MNQTPQSQPQNQQTDQTPKKGSSLTFQIIINTILVILGFVAEYILFSLIFLSTSHSSLAGLGLFFLLIAYVILGIPAIIISVIVMILAHKNLEKNPQVSKRIATFYLSFPIVTLLLIIPPLNLSIVPIALIPILLYDWFFIKIYSEAKNTIEYTVSSQVTAGKIDEYHLKKAQTNIVLPFIAINFIFIITSQIINTILIKPVLGSNFGPQLFKHLFAFFDGALVLFVTSNLIWILFKEWTLSDSEKTFLILKKIRKILLFSLIIVIPFWGLLLIASGFGDAGVGAADQLGYRFLVIIPLHIFFTALFTIPILISLLKSKKSKNEESTDLQTQSQPTPNSDPRFPTLDAQPKTQNSPPDNKKQG